jgi:hypothetical protein|tara:strand:+ start:385 stop:804 length:420 start_codon:yes stop_codon:yes gene_type:complete
MATLKYTIAISSDDAFPQAVAFSRTSTLDIDGDSSAIGEREVGTTLESILPTTDTGTVAIESRAFIYIKNDGGSTDNKLIVTVQDGDSDGSSSDADVMQLSGGDQVCFMYKHEDGSAKDVQVKSDTGTAYFSYAFCELT